MWVPVHLERPPRPDPFAAVPAAVVSVGRLVRRAATAGIDLVLPPSCPSCRVPLGTPGGLCLTCWSRVRFLEQPWCERLGTPFPYDLGPGTLSADAVAAPPPFARARSAVVYDGPVPDLVQAFKYADRTDLAPMFATWMQRAGAELLADADLVVPVPLHRRRLFRRRFNQAGLLAAKVAHFSGKPFRPDLLLRIRATRQQVGLTRESRDDNVRGAFRVPVRGKADLAGRRVLLVDDVFTTGATLEAATRPLVRAGAAAVDVLTLARVVRSG
jgi:ComF family protein